MHDTRTNDSRHKRPQTHRRNLGAKALSDLPRSSRILQFEMLLLNNTRVTDAGLPYLAGLTNLQLAELGKNACLRRASARARNGLIQNPDLSLRQMGAPRRVIALTFRVERLLRPEPSQFGMMHSINNHRDPASETGLWPAVVYNVTVSEDYPGRTRGVRPRGKPVSAFLKSLAPGEFGENDFA